MSAQPEALRLADLLEEPDDSLRWADGNNLIPQAAAELRRLHALNQELVKALKDAASCVQDNYLPDMMGHDWDEVIAKAENKHD